ncbi:MAG: hypothetical protein AAF490_33065 [Chloroflexota bacterium]
MSHFRTHQFHKFWLIITAIVVSSFGPIFFLGTMAATAVPAEWTLDLLHWPLDGAQSYDAQTTRFLSALTGGFLLGWGAMIYCLRLWVYDLAPEGVRRSVLIGALCWFFLDSAGSIASGAISNAFFNLFFLLLAIGPLWLPAKDEIRQNRAATAS